MRQNFRLASYPSTETGRTGRVRFLQVLIKAINSLGSNEQVCACAFCIDFKQAVPRSHCTQGIWPFQRSWAERKLQPCMLPPLCFNFSLNFVLQPTAKNKI